MTDVAAWHDGLGRATGLRPDPPGRAPAIVRFHDIDNRIVQPALDADILSIHLGGPKRVIRRQGYRAIERDVLENAFTIIPAWQPFNWETFGPIDFAHVKIDRAHLRDHAVEELDRDPDHIHLDPVVGGTDPQIIRLLEVLLAGLHPPGLSQLQRDALSATLSCSLLKRYAGRHENAGVVQASRGKLTTWQLRRIVDYMRAHLAEDMELATLSALTGLGRARFFEGFKTSMGRTPFAYLLHLRLLHARKLLIGTRLSVTEVAMAVGLEPTQLAAAFRRAFDITPRAFRVAHAF